MKDYTKLNKTLKIIGIILSPIGLIFSIVGFISFFNAFNSGEQPRLFFMCFIGLPLIFLGLACLLIGSLKDIQRYTASQTAPVSKDVANYMLDGTREELSKTINNVTNNMVTCPKCGCKNTNDSTFCKNCGEKLIIKCHDCQTNNSIDATYCKKCGKKLEK